MKHTQTHAQHLLCLKQMADICPAVASAGRTLATLLNGTGIQLIFGVEQIQFSKVGVHVAMASVPAWIYAVKEIHAPGNTLQNISRCSHTHQVCGLVCRKIGNHTVQDPVHLLMALSHGQSSHRIAVKVHFGDLFCVGNTDIIIHCALVNAEQHLLGIDGVLLRIQPCHLILTPCKPPCGSINRILDIFPVRHRGRALVKSHGNGGCQIGLYLHTFLRSHENLMPVNVGIEINPLLFDLP